MRLPWNVLRGRVNGFSKRAITRRTVPCFKTVIDPQGEHLETCLLVDSKYLYRYPYKGRLGIRSLAFSARYLKGEMENLRLREFQPGLCRYVHPHGTPKSG
jgi:hypothetical protein